MEVKLENDHDWGLVFWENAGGIFLCHHSLIPYVLLEEEVETIYVVTAPKCPLRAKEAAFRIYNDCRGVHVRDAPSLPYSLLFFLQKAYRGGDRYAWIEY